MAYKIRLKIPVKQTLASFKGVAETLASKVMYTPQQQWGANIDNPILREQLAYDPIKMAEKVDDLYPRFNPEQKDAFDKVMDSANSNRGNIFSFTVLEVVERPMSATPLLQQSVHRERLPFVLLLQLLLPFSSMVVTLLIHAS